MKILVIGDSHGNIVNLKHVMGFAKRIKIVAVIHTGDWNNVEAVNAVLNFNIPTFSVLGNADIDPNVQRLLKQRLERFALDRLKFKIENRKIGVIHSFKVSGEWYKDCDIVFCGHRHSQDERVVNGVKVVRPGALANGIHFAVYDTDLNKVEFINL